MLTSHLHLTPKLTTSRVIPLLHLYAFTTWMENYPFFTISLPHFENWLHLLHTVNRTTKKRYRKIGAVWDVTLCSLVKKKGKEPLRNLYTKMRGRTPHKTSVTAPDMKM